MPHVEWRDLRGLSGPQREFIDALTCKADTRYEFDKGLELWIPGSKSYDYTANRAPMVLYGGAGFGGKSYGIRSAAVEINGDLRNRGFPGRWGSIYCKRYTELADRQISKVQIELCSKLGLGSIRNTKARGLFFQFHDPSMGGFYFRNLDDAGKVRGFENDWILVDELTELMRDEIDHLLYTLRAGEELPYYAFGAGTNPDGPGHGWVKKLWILSDFEDEPDGITDRNYIFVGAKATDNPNFNAVVQSALTGFSDPMLIQARWDGSWDLASGTRFSTYSRPVHLFNWTDFEDTYGINKPWQTLIKDEDSFTIYGSFDFGTDINAASAFYLHIVDWKRRVWTFNELYMQGWPLHLQAEAIAQVCEKYNVLRVYADPSLQGRDSDGISRFSKFRNYGIPLVPGINDRVEGWTTMETMMRYKMTGGVMELQPEWRIHESCKELHTFLANAPRDELSPEDVSRKFKKDHAGDSVRYMLHSHFGSALVRPA